MKPFLIAFQFLTIIPLCNNKGTITEQDMGRAVAFFPLTGAVQGGILYCTAWLFGMALPPDLTACLVLCLLYTLSGGLHIDGLSDTFDGIAATRHDKNKRLSIMKDSASGPIGVLALVMVVLIKWAAIKTILTAGSAGAIVMMPVLGKWAMVPAIFYGKPARMDGIGWVFMTNTGWWELLAASVIAGIAALALAGPTVGAGVMFMLYLLGLGLRKLFTAVFGGLTGDSLGAICELAEAGCLVFYLGLVSVTSLLS